MFEQSLLMLSHEIARSKLSELDKACRISVIVPCYNSAAFIRPCLESLANQTLMQAAFEVICIDDCSTDDTLSVLSEWENRLDNLRIIRHACNRKQGAARNTGLDAARGEYVIFVDSDDFLRPDALELLLSSASSEADVIIGQLLRVRYDKDYTPKPAFRRMPQGKELGALTGSLGWFPVCMLIKADNIRKGNIRFREGVYFEDIDFCIRLFLACGSCQVLNEKIYYYVQRDGSTVNSMNEVKLSDSASAMSCIFEIIKGRPDLIEVFCKTANSWLRLQASRIRDGGAELDVRQRLGVFFVGEIRKAGVDRYLDEGSINELSLIAAGVPKQLASPSDKVDGPVSSSPWGGYFENDFSGKVIFFCEVDYHIRTAAPVVRQLQKLGIPAIIVDAAKSTSFSANRPLPEAERVLYSDIDIREFDVAIQKPFSTEAAAFVFMNDLTYTKELILENFGFGVPTFGFYEGINDDWNLDRRMARRPYRSVDYLLLPGIYQQGFYPDREARVVGLPNIVGRLGEKYVKPGKRSAIINVNFTYGVLEDRRDIYVESAVSACNELGLDYVISQHPADKGNLTRYNVGNSSVYSLLEEGEILISRFSTTILEALALGRPVVYYNPIGECVPKFTAPLGAFSVADSQSSLKDAISKELDFLDGGGSVRERAALFLHFHCNTACEVNPDLLAAQAIADVVRSTKVRYSFKRPMKDLDPETAPMALTCERRLSEVDLSNLAAQLLLEPTMGRAYLKGQASIVKQALLSLPNDSEVKRHFERVVAFSEVD